MFDLIPRTTGMDWLNDSIMRQRGVAQGRKPDTHALTEALQGKFHYTIGPYSDPVLRIRPGDRVVVDTRDADHEAGDLLQAGIDVAALPTLGDVVCHIARPRMGSTAGQTVFFKNCGWAGWDLAAARCAVAGLLA
jgi:ornithine cyclodeaminase/alanine dehydrogenase-like protein (mu-crystallin family)